MSSRARVPVGLGIMGFADLCLNLKVTYGSPASIDLMDEMMGFIRREAWNASIKIGAEKGTFPEFEPNREAYEDFLYNQIGISRDVPLTPRNYEVTTIAPTGTISLVAETSSGIEPNFSWAYVRKGYAGHADVCPYTGGASFGNGSRSNGTGVDR